MTEFLKRYEKYRQEIQDYMKYVEDSLMDKYGEIYPHYLVSLDTLAMNIDIMLKAKESFDNEGFHHADHAGVQRKSGAVQIFNTAQTAALKIMSQFGLNPMAEARMKTNKVERSIAAYASELMGEE
jgi:phage terminase small subunit